MASAPRLFIVAGEPSGDRLGADLLKRLRIHTMVQLLGVGGPELEGEGLHSIFPMSNLAVMGITDVLLRLPLLYWRVKQTVRAILREKPELVLLIDSQVFSQTVATDLREAGYVGKILLYVAPSVWAWKPERAPALRKVYDEVLAVLPFEPGVMRRLGGPSTTYVGHPALEQSSYRSAQPDAGPLLLLPGSRRGELRRHLPLMRQVAEALTDHPRVKGFVLPTVRGQLARVAAIVKAWRLPIAVTANPDEKRLAFANAVAAVAVAGTITLELALSGVPMVTTYVGDNGQRKAAEKYALRFVSLPNILADKDLVPEITGVVAQPKTVIDALAVLLGENGRIETQREGFAAIRVAMLAGTPDAPLTDAATRVLDYLRLLTGT